MEEEFIIRTLREGTVKTTPEIEEILNRLGTARFSDRLLGKVTAIAEMEEGRITKNKYIFDEDNDPRFNEKAKVDAEALVEATRKAVEGGGGGNEGIRVKFVVKM